MSIAHSEQLIDYADKKKTTTFNERKVEYGVKIIYKEASVGTYITVYPNGIKHSDATQTLNRRLEETFNMNVLSVDHQLSYTRYLLRDVDKQQMGVTGINYWTTRIAILIALDTGMRPQEIQALKWSQITNDGKFKAFQINDSWNEKEKHLNGHLKSRPHGESRLTLTLSEPLLQLLNKFRHRQLEFLKENGLINSNDMILLNITNYHLCALGYLITQRRMNDMLRQLSKKVGVNNQSLNISMYTCRHTVATKLGNTPGMSYPWAASRLGHSLKMFMRTYVHVDKDRNEEMLNLINNW